LALKEKDSFGVRERERERERELVWRASEVWALLAALKKGILACCHGAAGGRWW
jgi:hypothetical protein